MLVNFSTAYEGCIACTLLLVPAILPNARTSASAVNSLDTAQSYIIILLSTHPHAKSVTCSTRENSLLAAAKALKKDQGSWRGCLSTANAKDRGPINFGSKLAQLLTYQQYLCILAQRRLIPPAASYFPFSSHLIIHRTSPLVRE